MVTTPVSSVPDDAIEVVAVARRLIAARAALHDAIGNGYIIDSAWHLLLALFVADGALSDSQIAAQTLTPRTVARRWYAAFVADGLADRVDAGNGVVRLNPNGRRIVTAAIRAIEASCTA